MGLYINPTNMSKEQWLKENATETNGVPKWDPTSGKLPVCLVDNGMFTAAGICFSHGELQAFSGANDPRPKKWFEAPIEKLSEVTDGALATYLKNNQKFVKPE